LKARGARRRVRRVARTEDDGAGAKAAAGAGVAIETKVMGCDAQAAADAKVAALPCPFREDAKSENAPEKATLSGFSSIFA
jgi:hypothetical protein